MTGQPLNPERAGTVHVARGIAILVVLGPVVLMGALLVVEAAISMLLSGLDPRAWFSTNAADWIFGAGVDGDGLNYIRLMGGTLLAAGGATGIRWGFYGSER